MGYNKSEAELKIENQLITQLTSGESQWEHHEELRSESALWENFKRILEENNQAALEGVPLTEKEFHQIQNQLNFSSYFEASKWLAGENGIAKVQVQREDAKYGKIRLSVFWREEVAGGHSVYQVVNQVERNRANPEDQDRRLDVTLLINGLPLIHIELKNQSHPYMDAFRQIKKYLVEDKLTGIYSCLQMFVVTNNTDTRYIASASAEKLNEQFLATWVDKKNNPVNHLMEFADCTLSIPAAHKMVSQYTVIDTDKKALILLRPYQIHAIEAVKEASKKRQSGYIWHTTGSGKTLTSYKVARNLLSIPRIEKTIFIIDRVDLDQQTSSAFRSYAANDVIDVDNTEDVTRLVVKLASDERTVVVTTIQKLNHLMERAYHPKNKENKKYAKIRALEVAFVVDECHRAISLPKQRELKKFFPKSLWYGFTGTPIFEENNKKIKGGLQVTTKMQYGECLHEYTVKEAIHDKAVLGFKVKYNAAFSDDTLKEEIVFKRLKNKQPQKPDEVIWEYINSLTDEQLETYIVSQDYNHIGHMEEVADFIINKSSGLLGFKLGEGRTYTAILTTSSIEKAQRYYELFQKIRSGQSNVKISDKTKKKLPDFPKVAITYSISENEEASIHNQTQMKKSLTDYNAMFDKKYGIEEIAAYNADVNDRLARKKDKFAVRYEQLDLVIVVDRLLTGFDAPCLSALYIDRQPMKPQDLIQAFSRTNRIFDKNKQFGNIVTFQQPKSFKIAVDEALKLYSNGGEDFVLAPEWGEVLENLSQAVHDVKEITPSLLEIDIDNAEDGELEKVAKRYQTFDKLLNLAAAYSEYYDFTSGILAERYALSDEMLIDLNGKYQNVIEELGKRRKKDDKTEIQIDIEYELTQVSGETINHNYILNLIQVFIPNHYEDTELNLKARSEVGQYIEKLELKNPQLASLMAELWEDIQKKPNTYIGKHITHLLDELIYKTEKERMENFVATWQVSFDSLNFLVKNWRSNLDASKKQNGEDAMIKTSDYVAYRTITENPVSKLKYHRSIREAVYEMMIEEILPLRER